MRSFLMRLNTERVSTYVVPSSLCGVAVRGSLSRLSWENEGVGDAEGLACLACLAI